MNSKQIVTMIITLVMVVGTTNTISNMSRAVAEPACMTGFTLVTTTYAVTRDPNLVESDKNNDGLLCFKEQTVGNGTKILVTDNQIESHGGACPDHFNRIEWTTAAAPDRNENGFVCEKVVPGKTVIIDDNKPCEEDCNPAPEAGTKIVFSSSRDTFQQGDNFQIYKMNSDGSSATRLTSNTATDFEPSWSPSGTQIVFASTRDGDNDIYKMNADGSSQTRLTTDPAIDFQPNWSVDDMIVFHSFRDGDAEIYVMNADGTGQTRLTNSPGSDGFPSWSPDGSQIVFASFRDGDAEIYVMNADGTGQTRLTNSPGSDRFPDWSPDGSQIVFESQRDGNSEIYVMNADGSSQTRLTSNGDADTEPCWSPDGSQIVFHSFRDGNEEIYKMNADGTGQTRLTNNLTVDRSPDWGTEPDSP